MILSRISVLFILVTTLAGCVSSPVAPSFNSNDSKALNIVRAAGISAKLEDRVVPINTVTGITDSAGYGVALAASGYNAPIPGFSPGQMAGLNFTSWLFAPQADTARNSFFAWFPSNISDGQPVDEMSDMLKDASIAAANDLGYKAREGYIKNKSALFVHMTKASDPICKNEGNCFISYGIRTPRSTVAPDFVGTAGDSFFFDPAGKDYSRFFFNKNFVGFNELEFLVKVSQYMPEWFYFYIAPKKIKIDENTKIRMPLIVNQGRVHHFIKSEP